MAVTNETVLRRILKEVNEALSSAEESKMKKHVEHIVLLSELIIESKANGDLQNIPSDEMKHVSPEISTAPVQANRVHEKHVERIDSGDSIFDF